MLNQKFNYTCEKRVIPDQLKYIDVIKQIHTDLDVAQNNELMII